MQEFPGPEAKRILSDNAAYYAETTVGSRIVVHRGEGAFVTDVDGNRFYDLHCDASVNNLGRNNTRVANAIIRQLRTGNFFSEHHNAPGVKAAELSKVLSEKSPVPKPAKIFLSNSGAEANEAARKLCRAHRVKNKEAHRTKAVYFANGFAGRTKGVIAGTSSKPEHQRDPFWDHCDKKDSIYIPYPALWDFDEALSAFEKIDLASVDRVQIELSCQGEGGIIPANGYAVSSMRQMAQKAGVLWIVDAIQCGMGRDGSLFGCETLFTGAWPAIEPDILTLGKALGGGLPIGATVFRSDLDFEAGQHSNTFGGGPLVASAALAAFFQLEHMVASGVVKKIEGILGAGLLKIWADNPGVITEEPRGRGAMWAVEFGSRDVRDRIIEMGEDLVLQHGVGLRLLGAGRKSIRFMPPLVITPEELHEALYLFEQAVLQYRQ